jgi:hypothetical protein
MIAEFVLTVLYTQITVAQPDIEQPGLLWTDEHVAQGFAWAPGTVGFGVPDHDGQSRLRIRLADAYHPKEGTLWAVQTPFDVTATPILIGTILDERPVPVPLGTYNLVFEALEPPEGGADFAYELMLHFVPTPEPDFAIVKPGGGLTTDHVLRRDAEPAQ